MSLFSIGSRAKMLLNKTSIGRLIIEARQSLIASSPKARARRAAYRADGVRVAAEACEALSLSGLNPFLNGGSLLGAIRAGEFMPYDDDLDLAIVITEDFDWKCVESALSSSGFQKVREFAHLGVVTEQAYSAGTFNFDVFGLQAIEKTDLVRTFFYTRLPNTAYDLRSQLSVLYSDIPAPKSIKHVSVSGTMLPVPTNAEAILASIYGPGWKVPDPNWVSGTGMNVLDGVLGEATLWLK